MSSESDHIQLNIKGPSDTKLSLSISPTATVADLKQLIEDTNADFPKDQQRLIYSGRVLKDQDELVAKYNLKTGHTIHLVKGRAPAAPVPGPSSAAAGVPDNFAAGQQIAGNPLAPLLNAQNAGALGGFNPFAQMGINANDPNYMQNMMNDPAVQANVSQLLSDPAVLDQVIASNPELRAMGPQVRQLMQSEYFRSFLTNPESMRNMMQMMQSGGYPGMGGGAGAGGAGGAGGFPPPGAFGWGSGAAGAGAAAAGAGAGPATGGAAPNPGLFNPWASTPSTTTGAGAVSPPAAGAAGAFNPFAGAGGAGGAGAGGHPDFASMMAQMQALQGMGFGGFGAQGGASPSGGGGAPQQSPEERFAPQLEQLAGMGFHDASRNVRALLASGGNVEGAVEWLFSN